MGRGVPLGAPELARAEIIGQMDNEYPFLVSTGGISRQRSSGLPALPVLGLYSSVVLLRQRHSDGRSYFARRWLH